MFVDLAILVTHRAGQHERTCSQTKLTWFITVRGFTKKSLTLGYFTREGDCLQTVSVGWHSQVSIHVAASHKASQHQTLISQIQIVGPDAILA